MSGHYERPWVISVGLCTPLGLDAPTTLVEVAAGTSKFIELEDVVGRNGEPIVVAVIAALAGLDRGARISALARRAAWEAIARARGVGLAVDDMPVYVGLPEPSNDDADLDLDALRGELQAVADGVRLHFPPSWACRQGRAGFLFALSQALAALDGQRCEAALVGGVDSLCDARTLRELIRAGRMQGDGVDGLIPGEGAGFVVLVRSDRWTRQVPGAFSVLTTALGHHGGESGVEVGGALSGVFRSLRAQPILGGGRCHHLLTCQTGESRFATEFGVAYMRNGPLFPEPMAYDFVAESFASCGAASGALAMGLAQRSFAQPRVLQAAGGEQARVLVYGSSDHGFIGACVLGSGPVPGDLGTLAVAQTVAAKRRFVELVSRDQGLGPAHYEDHLEEVDALLEERRYDLETGASLWSESDVRLETIERHIDALVLGGAQAYALAMDALVEGDVAVEAASLRLLCGRGALESDLDLVRAAICEQLAEHLVDQGPLRFDNRSWRKAMIADAIRFGDHARLDATLHAIIDDPAAPVAARRFALDVAVWRRRVEPEQLARVLYDEAAPPKLRAGACLGLARVGAHALAPAVLAYAERDRQNPELLEALLRMRSPQALDVVRWIVSQGQPGPGHLRLLGVAGDPSDTSALIAVLSRAAETPELGAAACDALGCIGLVDSVAPLLDAWVQQPGPLAAAALALERITAAGLAPPEGEDDEGEDETEHGDQMKPALTRMCLDPELWRCWWNDNNSHFTAGQCCRNGQPAQLDACLVELAHEGATPQATRELAELEFAVRSGVASEFEADAPAHRQRRALARWRATVFGH